MIERRRFLGISLSACASIATPSIASPLTNGTLSVKPLRQNPGIEVLGERRSEIRRQIKVIGVGRGGCTAVEKMIGHGAIGTEFICVDTDTYALEASHAGHKIVLGLGGYLDGAWPVRIECGRSDALAAGHEIRKAIRGADLLLITSGMGGGTGIGASSVIARMANEMGILTVGVVTTPFDFEGQHRMMAAMAGLVELETAVESLIVVSNQKLLEALDDDVSQVEVFAHSDEALKKAIDGVVELVNVPGDLRLAFNAATASNRL